MDENKKKKLEERLREMIISEDQKLNEKPRPKSKTSGAKVIRRRKGSPDLQIS
jgi:hypothetical protein